MGQQDPADFVLKAFSKVEQKDLAEFVVRGADVVESLITKKRMPAFATSRISTLEDVAIYTYDEDIPIRQIFVKMFEKYEGNNAVINKASNKELMDIMESVLPDFDKERVYVSDIKKMISWYNHLIDNKILIAENIKTEGGVVEEKPEETPVENKEE
jgi:hypothetical protein